MSIKELRIMGIHEIAEQVGVSPELVAVWNSRGKLPEPDAVIGGGRTKVWHEDTIRKWAEEELG